MNERAHHIQCRKLLSTCQFAWAITNLSHYRLVKEFSEKFNSMYIYKYISIMGVRVNKKLTLITNWHTVNCLRMPSIITMFDNMPLFAFSGIEASTWSLSGLVETVESSYTYIRLDLKLFVQFGFVSRDLEYISFLCFLKTKSFPWRDHFLVCLRLHSLQVKHVYI